MGRRKHRRGIGVVRYREDIKKYVIDYYDNLGRRHVKTIGTNQHEAVNALKEQIQLSKDNRSPQADIPFETYAGEWLKRKIGIVKESTQISYEGILVNHLIPHFGNGNLSEIKKPNIKDFVRDKVSQGKLSRKTLRNILVVLHEILDEAEDDGLITTNPYPNKINRQINQMAQPLEEENGKVNGKAVDYLERDEVILFFNACEDPKEDPQNYALFYTAIFTGMRRGELLGLKWGDIDWNKKQIHVQRTLYKMKFQKPKSEYSIRAIDIGDRLIEVLKRHRIKQNGIRLKVGSGWVDNDLVFCQKDGTCLDGDNLYHRDFHRILKRAGLRQIRIHDLRHTFASLLIAANHNPKYIQSQMGHGSIQITMDLYAHLMKEVHNGAADATANVIFDSGNVMVTEYKKGVTANAATPRNDLVAGA